jgi:hypothetical protein
MAIRAVETRYFPDIDAALGKMGLASDRAAEVKQGLRKLLFVGEDGAPPRISEYRGSGDLRAWLRVTAMRAALKLLRKHGRETSTDDAILEARSSEDDPELALQILIRATDGHRRVLREPPPVARLMSFGDHGIELELRFWITDPQEGVNNVRSDVNRAIWRQFKEAGITIPVAQREVRLEMVGSVPQARSYSAPSAPDDR